MKKFSDHIILNLCSVLVLAGFFLSILFGQGTHLHTMFNHFSDHGDIHAYVHAHHHSSAHAHTDPGFELDNKHDHPTAFFKVKGVRTQHAQNGLTLKNQSFTSTVPVGVQLFFDDQISFIFDLPPPQRSSALNYSFSYSLRAPPEG